MTNKRKGSLSVKTKGRRHTGGENIDRKIGKVVICKSNPVRYRVQGPLFFSDTGVHQSDPYVHS